MPRKGNPSDIEKYGHTASTIKQALKARKINAIALAQELKVTNSTVYGWVNARWAPNPKYHAKLAQVLGIAEQDLIPNQRSNTLPVAPRTSTNKRTVTRLSDLMYSFIITPDGKVQLNMTADEFQDYIRFLTTSKRAKV